MNLALTVLQIVAPVFMLAGIGFTWVKAGLEYRIQFVTQLAMTLSLPCLIFVSLMQTDIDPSALAALSMASVTAYGAVTLAILALVRLIRLDTRTYAAPLIFGNTGNLGLPLALFAFGDIGLSYAIIVFAIMALWSYTFGIWLVAGAGSFGKVLREPLVWGTVLGALFLWQGWETPIFLTNALDLVGQMAIPMMLITLGVAVARLSAKGLMQAAALSAIKLGLCTGIAWVVGQYFTLDPTAFGVLVLQVATPVAVTSYLLAEKYGAQSDKVAGLVVASTLMSVAALPLILALVL
ncbi:AEC family transporter [Tateyamaria sp. ANG-S1]|uniref:AEC family transporter n=1 Tax=Tateyamaria sp. ANG-S1 TaxID=1577905 RepID=UPI00057C9764|nr:AEC family transporter [Tateyamaria sp. ANG-S1]KIC49939.1 transporter [Tateyamaria sp. ANG-S1]